MPLVDVAGTGNHNCLSKHSGTPKTRGDSTPAFLSSHSLRHWLGDLYHTAECCGQEGLGNSLFIFQQFCPVLKTCEKAAQIRVRHQSRPLPSTDLRHRLPRTDSTSTSRAKAFSLFECRSTNTRRHQLPLDVFGSRSTKNQGEGISLLQRLHHA